MTFEIIETTLNQGEKANLLWITLWKLGISRKKLYTRVIFENSKIEGNYQKT